MEPLGTDIEVWNILHDGCLVDIAGSVPGDVTVVVEIQYLRAMLPEPGNRFLIRLIGCQLFEFRRFVEGQTLIGDQATVAADEPEILSTKLQGGTAVISMTRGAGTYMELHLQYDDVSVSTEDGRVVPVDELAAAAQRYWEDFEHNR